MSRFTSIALACTALALALGACGDDEESRRSAADPGDNGATVRRATTPSGLEKPSPRRAKVGQKSLDDDDDPHNVTPDGGRRTPPVRSR